MSRPTPFDIALDLLERHAAERKDMSPTLMDSPVKQMTAKFGGTCIGCSRSFGPGEQIYWLGKNGCYHDACFTKAMKDVPKPARSASGAPATDFAKDPAFMDMLKQAKAQAVAQQERARQRRQTAQDQLDANAAQQQRRQDAINSQQHAAASKRARQAYTAKSGRFTTVPVPGNPVTGVGNPPPDMDFNPFNDADDDQPARPAFRGKTFDPSASRRKKRNKSYGWMDSGDDEEVTTDPAKDAAEAAFAKGAEASGLGFETACYTALLALEAAMVERLTELKKTSQGEDEARLEKLFKRYTSAKDRAIHEATPVAEARVALQVAMTTGVKGMFI